MKTLSDYKGEEAIELWGDLLELFVPIFSDREIAKVASGGNKFTLAKVILARHKKEAEQILLRIDPTPIDGLNIVIRLVQIITEVGKDDYVKSFFGFAEQGETDSESIGLPTESTEVEGK